MKIVTAENLSNEVFTLRARYRDGIPPALIPASEVPYDPHRHKKTHAPQSLGILMDRTVFSAPFRYPAMIDIQIKAAQSDVYHVPRELGLRYGEFLQRCIDREHNRTPTAFTRGVFMQARQGVESPAGYWHYDIGNPSRTYLSSDMYTAIYASGFPLRLAPALRRQFDEARNLSQESGRQFLLEATDFEQLKHYRKNGVSICRMRPFEIATHDQLALHKGISAIRRMLVTITYIDTDQPARYGFTGFVNNIHPDIGRARSAPAEEAAGRLSRYLERHPALHL